MKIIERYLSTVLIRFILMVLAVIVAVDFFIHMVHEFGAIGTGSYGIGHAFLYVLTTLWEEIYSLFPMVGLLGCLIGLGLLAQHSELLVMRAAGMTIAHIIKIVLCVAVVLILLVTLLGETAVPAMFSYGTHMKLIATSGGQALQLRHGLWLRDKNDYIYIDTVEPNMQLDNILIYEFNKNNKLNMAVHAGSANKISSMDWKLKNVTESIFDPQHVTSRKLSSLVMSLSLNTRTVGEGSHYTAELSLYQLYSDIAQERSSGMNVKNFELAFWQRIAQPFAALVMILLSIPFIFGPLRSVTMGLRIVTGAAVGFAFYLLNQFFGPFCLVYQIPPIIGAFLPTILFAVLGLYLLSRVR